MKIKYLKLKHWLLASLAGALGLTSSCGVEYGCPEAIYAVKGTVTDEQSHPIAGIEVSAINNEYPDYPIGNAVRTNDDGSYMFSYNDFPYTDYQMTLHFSDVDSSDNGSYADTTVVVSYEGVPYEGGHGQWYWGTATATVNMKMRERQ